MSVYLKVKKAQLKLWLEKARKEALKLALAVVIAEFLIAGGWYLAESKGILDIFTPKTVIVYQAQAKTTPDQPVEVIEQADKPDRIDKLVDYVWLKESTRGKNNYSQCEKQGLVNGIGYGIPGNGKYICFSSHNEEVEVLRGWIETKLASGYSEKELLCIYNTGKATGGNCNYIKALYE